MLKLEEDLLPRSPQTSLPVPGTVTRIRGAAHTVEEREVNRLLFVGYCRWTDSQRVRLTINRQLFS